MILTILGIFQTDENTDDRFEVFFLLLFATFSSCVTLCCAMLCYVLWYINNNNISSLIYFSVVLVVGVVAVEINFETFKYFSHRTHVTRTTECEFEWFFLFSVFFLFIHQKGIFIVHSNRSIFLIQLFGNVSSVYFLLNSGTDCVTHLTYLSVSISHYVHVCEIWCFDVVTRNMRIFLRWLLVSVLNTIYYFFFMLIEFCAVKI